MHALPPRRAIRPATGECGNEKARGANGPAPLVALRESKDEGDGEQGADSPSGSRRSETLAFIPRGVEIMVRVTCCGRCCPTFGSSISAILGSPIARLAF